MDMLRKFSVLNYMAITKASTPLLVPHIHQGVDTAECGALAAL